MAINLASYNYSNQFGSTTLTPTATGGINASSFNMTTGSATTYGALSAAGSIFNGLMSSIQQKKQNKANAQTYDEQAMALEKQGQNLYQSASLSATQAELALELGKQNSASIITASGQIEPQKQILLRKTNEQARARIGAGKTAYASAGILLESRADAAVAKWEQDEEANATLEKLNIINQAENTLSNYLTEAHNAKIQGHSAALNYYGQAAVTATEATTAMEEAARLRRLAEELRKKDTSGGILGGILQAACTIGGAAIGGPVGASIGSAIGGVASESLQASY